MQLQSFPASGSSGTAKPARNVPAFRHSKAGSGAASGTSFAATFSRHKARRSVRPRRTCKAGYDVTKKGLLHFEKKKNNYWMFCPGREFCCYAANATAGEGDIIRRPLSWSPWHSVTRFLPRSSSSLHSHASFHIYPPTHLGRISGASHAYLGRISAHLLSFAFAPSGQWSKPGSAPVSVMGLPWTDDPVRLAPSGQTSSMA